MLAKIFFSCFILEIKVRERHGNKLYESKRNISFTPEKGALEKAYKEARTELEEEDDFTQESFRHLDKIFDYLV